MLKVKITGCSQPMYWYKNLVGKTIDIRSIDETEYGYRQYSTGTGVIQDCDCEIVRTGKHSAMKQRLFKLNKVVPNYTMLELFYNIFDELPDEQRIEILQKATKEYNKIVEEWD